MKAFIYTGGKIYPSGITEHPKSDDLCIAADSGYQNALSLGERVDILLGDFDSYRDTLPEGAKIIKLPAEKDLTDTQVAIREALSRGADDIVIIGGLSGRIDHALANLNILPELWELRVHALINDGANRVRYINSSSTLIARSHFKYVSVIPIDKKLRGVSIEGCKYPLSNATVSRSGIFTVSNEIDGNCALISVRKGACYVVESRDIGEIQS